MRSAIGFWLASTLASLLSFSFPVPSRSGAAGWRVAVIGGGIGGASVTYNLREIDGLSVDVYEASSVGGRAHDFQYGNEVLEMGASIIWEYNYYLLQVAKELKLQIRWLSDEDTGDSSWGIWDGHAFAFEKTSSKWSYAKLMARYGWPMLRYQWKVMDMFKKNFKQIYDLQAQNVSFTCPEEMLRRVGLYDYTQRTADDFIKGVVGKWFVAFREELASAVNRVNYNQRNSQMNAFAGFVSFAPAAGGGVWSVAGGNRLLAESMLAASRSLVLQGTRVLAVRGAEDGRLVVLGQSNAEMSASVYGSYDAVVVATPLEAANIAFEDLAVAPRPARQYQTTVTTYVKGTLQASYFGKDKLEFNTVMLTESAEANFSSISMHFVNGTPIYKVFSSDHLGSETVQALFGASATVLQRRVWAAYPQFHPPEQFSPFVLCPGVFYNNAIENVASAMEMSAIAARNSALLVLQHLENTSAARKRDATAATGATASHATADNGADEMPGASCPGGATCPVLQEEGQLGQGGGGESRVQPVAEDALENPEERGGAAAAA